MAPTSKSHRKAIEQAAKKQKAHKRTKHNLRRAKEERRKIKALKEAANRPGNLQSLPTEITDRILGYSESPEVVSVALACPTVYRILRARHGRLQNVLSATNLPRNQFFFNLSYRWRRADTGKLWDFVATKKPGCVILCDRTDLWGHWLRWVRVDAMLAALQQYTTRRLGNNYFHTECECNKKLEQRVSAYNILLEALPTNRRIALRKDLTKAERVALVADRSSRRAELQLEQQKCVLALRLIEKFR
ncbi:uncharacterized protein AB675_7941 [Cyphellophora attinorum]|uniref:F-box domain-containing protein n=1 Tax=Cyphellophora attinorum TaxID=1664694 RepID=A0A0N0NN81_9EURO|nr:uncharacterized protein AB675_7941 [Phialophora attinorum]KPI41069.1 hypothetical protein AB675_7941 [Phialophora attinorum]